MSIVSAFDSAIAILPLRYRRNVPVFNVTVVRFTPDQGFAAADA
jgi:hypothetical protein